MPVSEPIQSEQVHEKKRNMFRFQLVCSKQSNIFSSYVTNLFVCMIVTKKERINSFFKNRFSEDGSPLNYDFKQPYVQSTFEAKHLTRTFDTGWLPCRERDEWHTQSKATLQSSVCISRES